MKLFSNIGTGVKQLYYEPAQGMKLSGKEFMAGLGRGTADFLGGVTMGVTTKPCEHHQHCLCVSVADTGIGISDDAQKKLFGMFMKIKDARVRNPLGVGLGVCTCFLMACL